jgi:hypothetical protein
MMAIFRPDLIVPAAADPVPADDVAGVLGAADELVVVALDEPADALVPPPELDELHAARASIAAAAMVDRANMDRILTPLVVP